MGGSYQKTNDPDSPFVVADLGYHGKRNRVRPVRAIWSAAAMLVVTGGAVTGIAAFAAGTTTSTTTTPEQWVTDNPMLNQLNTIDPVSAQWFFNTSHSFVLGGAVSGFAATPVSKFDSYAAFSQALAAGTLPSGLKWVAYDNEDWSATPLVEQQNPAKYMRLFANLAHKHGLHVIETPARDLVLVSGATCTKKAGQTLDQAYLACKIPADARYANIFEIQAQADETVSTSAYANLVATANKQVLAVAPTITVMSGLTTDGGQTATQVFDCWNVTHGEVAGYWMNTTSATVSVAAQALDEIRAAS